MKEDLLLLYVKETTEKYNKIFNSVIVFAKKVSIRFPTRYKLTINDDGESFVLDVSGEESYRFGLASTDNIADANCVYRFLLDRSIQLSTLMLRLEAMLSNDKWNIRFLNLAKTVSTYSKDPSTKVGAVIVDDDDNVRTIGYNGFPRGVKDTPERLNDRSIKYPLTVHAELNAICTCARVGVPTKGATMVCTHFPCADCAGAIVQAGVKEVVVLAPSEDFDSRWNETNNFARTIFTEGNVDVIVFTEDELKDSE